MILINGYFYCRRLTGIERYAIEITQRLDSLSLPGEISLIVPAYFDNIPDFKNIVTIRYGKKVPHILWQMFILQFFLLLHPGYTILDFGNTCLPFFPGIIFLHDIYCEFYPKDFSSFRDKIVRIYNRWQYRLIARKAQKICTVSNFSKNQISQSFSINPEKIDVIYSAWNHFPFIRKDDSIFNNYPLLSKPFYFLLGSLSKRKNIQWIIDYAAQHPNDIFAISGDSLPTAKTTISPVRPENIVLLGYLDDSKVKALMEKCIAFILPSYYEGFGLTPLEALSCGTRIIIANAASLPEVFEDSAYYIDPFYTDINLNTLLQKAVKSPETILKKYSFDISAEKVYNIIKEFSV